MNKVVLAWQVNGLKSIRKISENCEFNLRLIIVLLIIFLSKILITINYNAYFLEGPNLLIGGKVSTIEGLNW